LAEAAVAVKLMRVAALMDSDPAAAARDAAQILSEHPGDPQAALLLGTAHRNAGDLASAARVFAQLVAEQPEAAPIQFEYGRVLAAQGRDEEAFAALTRAVQLAPGLAPAWGELAALHARRGDELACDQAYAYFAQLAPPEQHLADAVKALANGRLSAAETLVRRRLAHKPQDVAALRLMGGIAAEREDYVESERLHREALRLAPGYGRARLDLVRTLYRRQQPDPMLPLLERLLRLDPLNLEYRALKARAFDLLGQNERALEILQTMIAEFPDDALAWIDYGHSLRTAGRQQQAVAAYRRAAQLRPALGQAWFSLANLKTFRFTPAEVETMRQQLTDESIPDKERLQLEFALGKALEDESDFERAFEHYAHGNALRSAMVAYDRGRTTRLVDRTIALYTREFLAARADFGTPAPDPIFIVGLPRAGSTLIEQILASHSQVEGTRELPDVLAFALELGERDIPGRPPMYPQSIARLSRLEVTALGERYLAQTRPHRLLGRARFIDKMPNNFFHIGLIHLMLPNARIIDARRSPLACCFSNFKQHFQSGLWFSYDLTDIGAYYRDYVRLMAHFDAVLPGRVHRVQYEKLVTDLEGEVGRLLDYCGLPFEERCLRFNETERVVQTASSEQVRQPLYTESLDQWRNFEPWLGPLKEALGELAR
jgi:tetratricopeptide (TPR) repeat protein